MLYVYRVARSLLCTKLDFLTGGLGRLAQAKSGGRLAE
jgi:hypothetical protein